MSDFITWLVASFDVFMQLARLLLDYLKVLVWPSVVFVLVLVYKQPIIAFLSRLRKASALGGAVELFADELADAADAAASQPPPEVPKNHQSPRPELGQRTPDPEPAAQFTDDPVTPPDLLSDLPHKYLVTWNQLRQRRVNLAPIDASWRNLANAADHLGIELGLSTDERGLSRIALELVRRGYLSTDSIPILTGLQALRRQISTAADEPTDDVIANFNHTANILIDLLDRARRRLLIDRQIRNSQAGAKDTPAAADADSPTIADSHSDTTTR